MNLENIQNIIYIPAMPLQQYADLTGQTFEAVKMQASDGRIPIVQAGKGCSRYVNIAAMHKACSEAATWSVKAPNADYEV